MTKNAFEIMRMRVALFRRLMFFCFWGREASPTETVLNWLLMCSAIIAFFFFTRQFLDDK